MSRFASAIAAPAVATFRALPGGWRERIKIAAGMAGHAPGWAQRLRARRLAAGVKRLDVASETLAGLLSQGGIKRLAGARCLEFGSGHLLSEALAYHLAGARRVVAVDYFPILQARELPLVCRGADPERIVAALGRFDSPGNVRARLAALMARKDWSLDRLAGLGISYVAPYDAARSPLDRGAFDVISSVSVLEHVPISAAEPILTNLFAMLGPGGTMVHAIHLEDHRDFRRDPFAFFAADTDWTQADCDRRGNRLRPSDWRGMAGALDAAAVDALVTRSEPSKLPDRIDPVLARYDRADLAAAGVVLTVRR